MTARRIDDQPGAGPIAFSFDGRSCIGREGDTIASALLANGVAIVGRSFKYHRPSVLALLERDLHDPAWACPEPSAILEIMVKYASEQVAAGVDLRAIA